MTRDTLLTIRDSAGFGILVGVDVAMRVAFVALLLRLVG